MFIPPLLVLPLIIYNLVAFDLVGGSGIAWARPVFSLSLPSGAIWSMSVADLLVVVALVLLLIDNLRARRLTSKLMSVGLSALVLLIYGAEFVMVPAAATSVFFACLVMSLADTIIRVFTRAAPRPVSLPRFEERY